MPSYISKQGIKIVPIPGLTTPTFCRVDPSGLAYGIDVKRGEGKERPLLACQLHRGAVHNAVEIHGCHRAVFQVVAFTGIGVAVFQDALHDHTVEASVTHHATLVFF